MQNQTIKTATPGASAKSQALKKLHQTYAQIAKHPFSDFTKNRIVFGEGDIDAQLLFLGEGPGEEEDLTGRPFVGKAGKLLTKMINAMGLEREETYITNVIKCRLANNRRPTMEEIAIEKNLILDEELMILQPKIICTLGASAMHAIFGQDCQLAQVRGKLFTFNNFKVLPTYHPAYLLRNPSAKSIVWADLQQIMRLLNLQTE